MILKGIPFMIALKALGYSMNTKNLDEIQEAYDWLIDQRYHGSDLCRR